jgi:hypothetical protein
MANTECMSDEFIESLATAGSSSAVVSTSSSSSSSSQDRRRQQEQRQRQQLRSRQMQNRLQKKMELPIGDSPAAKVVRASPNNQYTNSRAPAENIQESDGVVDPPSQPSPTHEDSTGARPLVGNIIEHNDNHRGNKKKVNGKGSRFSRNRQETNNTTTKTHSTGFPSVHDKPFGTFVKGKKKDGNRPINKTVTTSIDKRSNGTNNKNNVIDMNSSGRSDNNAHHLLQEASHNEAQSMLTGMSLEEIKDNQQEIRQALSPELMAFLKDRRKSKVQQKETASGRESSSLPSSSSTNNTIRTESTTATSTPDMSTSNKNKKSQEENLERDDKERMAKLVASIKTHEDLDATFRAEMKSDVFGIDFDEKDGDDDKNGKEQFLVACGLLRSTSPRQTLWAARTVSFKLNELITAPTFKLQQQLQQQQDNDNVKNDRTDPPATSVAETSTITKADLPSTLPVSLRCLLDKLLTSSCNYLLHTYALQSLYYLTIIYAHPDHDVIHYDSSSPLSLESGATTHTTSEKFTCSDVSIFQEDFMDDAVPTPPLDTAYPPMSVTPLAVPEEISRNNTNDKNGAPAYMTSSSTASALTEGEAFKKDPMWTLLSKMKILPRLSFLLEHQQHMTSIPVEALVAICGIVSMVGQRSPGAASAIVQHKTLTSQLLKRMMEQIQQGRSESGENSNNNNGRIIHATMRLFCILSRQSRVAAEGLPLEEILAPLLAVGPASSYEEFRTQQQALVLWRTMLRYGLGLEALPFMLTVSARHLALPYSKEFSLSSEFLSAFTLVLECVKVVWSKNHGASTAAAATATTTETLSTVHEDPTGMINPASIKIIETATKLMVSTLILSKKKSPFDIDTDLILKYRFNASRLLYLSTWFQLFDPAVNTYDDVAVEDYISLDDQETLLLTMQSWAEREGVIETAWKSVALWCDPSLNPEKLSRNITSIKVEAAASGVIHGYFSVALVLLRSKVSNSHIEDIKRSLHKILVRTIIEGLKSALKSQADHVTSAKPKYNNSAREGWIIQSHFAVAKFCFHSMSMGLIESSSDLTLVRSMVFSLLGRLQKGNESIAAVLYSSDALFQTCGNPVQEDTMSTESSSPISTMFLGEVCGSERARKQLDHSFKLQHGFGLTSAGFGPFALDSLLGNAEQPNTGPTGPNSTEDSTFPLGKFWIWQCLSGSIRMRDDVVAVGAEEATNVIAAVLGLILEQDETEEVMGIAGYMSRLPMGSKIYYLINICLQPEQVFRDERIFNCGEVILDRYLKHFGDDEIDIAEFCQECLDHSGRDSKISKITNDEEEDALQEKDKKLLDDFANAMEGDYNKDSQISHEEYRALEAFVEDLATAYREYGAQYDFFTKCIRIFLLPVFPSSIRCRALKELENMLHLLTVSKEYEDEDEMALLLSKSFVGGIPNIDNSIRDGAEILDAASRILARDSISPRPLDGYMRHYCIGLLVRSFASSLSTEQGIETSKLRMKRLNKKNVHTICKATSHLMQTDGSRSALVAAVIESSSYTNNNDEMTEKDYVEKCINNCINRHISSKSSDNR